MGVHENIFLSVLYYRGYCTDNQEVFYAFGKVQEALKTKKIHYEYTEENGCGSIDFMFRGLRFHIWEYEDRVWGAETNVFEAGRSQDIEGDYEEIISGEILSWPDMLPGM